MRTMANNSDVRTIPGVLALVLFLASGRAIAGPDSISLHLPGPLQSNAQRFDVHTAAGLSNLIAAAEAGIELSETEEHKWRDAREQTRAGRPLAELPAQELREYFKEPEESITRRDRRGLEQMQRLARAALETNDPGKREGFAAGLLEIAAALQNNHRSP